MNDIHRFEYQLLASICDSPEILRSLEISPKEFSDPKAGRMFEVLSDLVSEKKAPDPLLIATTLNFADQQEWLPFVSKVMYEYPSIPKNVNTYVDQIKKHYKKNQLLNHAKKLYAEIPDDPEAALSRFNSATKQLNSSGKGVRHISEILPEVIERIDRIQKGERVGVVSGIKKLDGYTGGFQPGDLVILAARTSVGKTAGACNFAVNCGVPAGFISAEQSGFQLAERVISNIGSVPVQRLRNGDMTESDWPKLSEAALEAKELPIVIADPSRPSIDEVEQIARRMQWEHEIKILFVDYLQIIRSLRYQNRLEELTDVSARLKGLAKECDIPIVALAQVKRIAEGTKPTLSDLRECGAIEQDADQVLFLYKNYEPSFPVDVENGEGALVLDMQKNRSGPLGHADIFWNGKYMRMENP